MSICYIISDIDKAVYFEETATALRDHGIEPKFVLINCAGGSLESFLQANNFKMISQSAGSLLKSWSQIKMVKWFLKQEQVTIVHCHLAQANWIGLWASKFAGVKKRIYTRHSGEPLQLHWKEKLIDKIQNRLATIIVAISKNIDDLLEKQGVQPRKRRIIHHGFNLEKFNLADANENERIRSQYNPTKAYPCIGVISRWLELKGIDYTLEAFKQLLLTYPDAKLYLFGGQKNNDYYSEILSLISDIPEKNIAIIPFEKNVYALYQLFDIYVHVPINSTCEAFGQTYVEALASGVPSIFSLSGVAIEFIENEKNALVVPYKNSSSIYESMIRLLENSELRNRIIQQGNRDVQELFGFNLYISKLIALYNE